MVGAGDGDGWGCCCCCIPLSPPHPTPPPQTWRSLSLPFLPRSKQFDTREDVQLAGLLIRSFAVARAAAAAAGVRLLPLPRLPLLTDQGTGDSRCPGHAPRGGRKQGYASRVCGWRGWWVRQWGGVGGKGRGVYTTHGSVRITHRQLQSRTHP